MRFGVTLSGMSPRRGSSLVVTDPSLPAGNRSAVPAEPILQSLTVGLVCGFLAVVLSLSLGNLLFFGEMREFVPIALGMALFTTAVVSAIAALTSPIRGAISISEEIPIVAIAGPAMAIVAAMSGTVPAPNIAVTIVAAAAIATLVTGSCLLFMGYFRLGRLIRFIPFPVTGGFLAGTGWLILQGGFSVIAGDAIGLSNLSLLLDPDVALKCVLGVTFAALIVLVQQRTRRPLVFPLMLLAALVAYNLVVAVLAIPPETLRQEGWAVPLRADGLWPPIRPADFALIDWDAILSTAFMLPGIVLVTAMALLMNATGIELDTGKDVDLDQELRSVGLQNLAAGAGGGVPGYPAVALSLLAARMGAPNRIVDLVVAAVTGCVLLLGERVLDLVPTPLLGSLLVWIGAAVAFEWLVLTARRVALWEYLILFLIFLVIVGVSFTSGILLGLIAAVVLFVVEYSRVDSVRHVLTGQDYQSMFEISEDRSESLRQHGRAILIVRLQGFIFFGTSDRLRKNIENRVSGGGVRFLVIDFRHVTGVDSSTVVSFIRLGQIATLRSCVLVMTGMNAAVERALVRGGLKSGANLRIEPDIDQGLVWCEDRLLAEVAPSVNSERPRSLAELALGIVKDARLASELEHYVEPVSLNAGETLIKEGSPSDEMYFVGEGRAAVLIDGVGSTPVRIATIGPGAIVGEVAFYLGKPRNASVVIESPVLAWRFSRASLLRLQEEDPDLAFRFHEGLAAMMASRLTSTNRLVSFLSD